jgi:DNA-binding IclR family transcriptional regulator
MNDPDALISSRGRNEPNQSVGHAFAILRLFAAHSEPIGVVEISRRLGLSLGTCHRVLATLSDIGYVAQAGDGGRYSPGIRIRELLLKLYDQFPIKQASLATMKRLSTLTGLATTLSVPVGDYAIRIGGVQDRQLLHRPLQLGMVSELHVGAAPLAMLANLPPGQRSSYLDTRVAPSVRGELVVELDRIRAAGHVELVSPQLRSIALAIRAPGGGAVASMALEGAPAYFKSPPQRDLTLWRSEVHALEDLLKEDPGLLRNPFGHIPPDSIHFSVRESQASRTIEYS